MAKSKTTAPSRTSRLASKLAGKLASKVAAKLQKKSESDMSASKFYSHADLVDTLDYSDVGKKARSLGKKKCADIIKYIEREMDDLCKDCTASTPSSIKWTCWSRCKAMFCKKLKEDLKETWLTTSQAEKCWMAVCAVAGDRKPSLYSIFKSISEKS